MKRPAVRFALLVAGVLAAAALSAFALPDRAGITAAVADAGPLGPVLAVLGSTLLIMAMFPRTALAFVSGLLFGLGPGMAYVLAGALLGASTAFLIGRLLGREYVDTVLAARPDGWRGRVAARLARIDGWLGRNGILGVITVRFLPVSNYGLVSYAFGTSAARYRDFLIGSGIGAVPSTFGYAALGAAVFGEDAVPTALAVLTGLGLLSLVVTMGLHRVRKPGTRWSPDSVKTG
ncbi:putative membrane protein YdjX (TVP38/TMEM64 family) [Actinocorallia herbida]|uniref:TVP38/TMEM64 family membrane protein n=1 Tax=Actinocorallia herbida TaxID=58109 RepID=A0A3N1DBW3_9ACTN|nr:VTT domain-containing protein [Actinocorallia herbida]ROO91013.1 putative membrane protein YdjX (TVP38/TMEM64 family) [Actinocorallia herbida]